ncbi:MAG: magnesium chelatase, partial [Bacteroidota bacterium]
PYTPIIQWFSEHELEVLRDSTSREYATALYQVPVLSELAKKYGPGLAEPERLVLMEFILHGLAEYSLIGKSVLDSSIAFGDLMGQIFSPDEAGDDE